MLNALLDLLDKGPDSALLRMGIAEAYLKLHDADQALSHLAMAVELDSEYSAAWKLYGKTLVQSGDVDGAEPVLEMGIDVATEKGDVQAVKEMQVFLKRIRKGV